MIKILWDSAHELAEKFGHLVVGSLLMLAGLAVGTAPQYLNIGVPSQGRDLLYTTIGAAIILSGWSRIVKRGWGFDPDKKAETRNAKMATDLEALKTSMLGVQEELRLSRERELQMLEMLNKLLGGDDQHEDSTNVRSIEHLKERIR